MKKTKFYALAAIALGMFAASFTSCSEEDATELNMDALAGETVVEGFVTASYSLNGNSQTGKKIATGTKVNIDYSYKNGKDENGNDIIVQLWTEAVVNNDSWYSAKLAVPVGKTVDCEITVAGKITADGTNSKGSSVSNTTCHFSHTETASVVHGSKVNKNIAIGTADIIIAERSYGE